MDNFETWTITMVCRGKFDPYVDTLSVGFPLDVEFTDRVSKVNVLLYFKPFYHNIKRDHNHY